MLCHVSDRLPVCLQVEFSVEQSTFHLLVDGIRVTDGHLPNNEGSSLDFHGHVYLGSDERSKTPKVSIEPHHCSVILHLCPILWACLHIDPLILSLLLVLTQRHNIPMDSIFGCIRDFKMNDVAVGIPEASHRALPCLDGPAVIGTYFTGGYIVLGLMPHSSSLCVIVSKWKQMLTSILPVADNYFTVGSDFVLAFELRPQHLTGLLFHVQSLKTSLNVFLMGNRVTFHSDTLWMTTDDQAVNRIPAWNGFIDSWSSTRWGLSWMMAAVLSVSQWLLRTSVMGNFIWSQVWE